MAMTKGLAGFVHIPPLLPPLRRAARQIGDIPDQRPKFEKLAAAAFLAIVDAARSVRGVQAQARQRTRA
jgi:hypothetical protein